MAAAQDVQTAIARVQRLLPKDMNTPPSFRKVDPSSQPILFIGSGFSLRYASGPNWEALLTALAQACPTIDKDFAYFKQKYDSDLTMVGSHFANDYFEWAWSKEGKQQG